MTKPLIPSSEFTAGRAAFTLGKPRSSCPYTKGAKAASPQRREWLRGYDSQRDQGADATAEPDPYLAHKLRNTNSIELWIRAEMDESEIPPTLRTAGVPDDGAVEDLPPGVQYG